MADEGESRKKSEEMRIADSVVVGSTQTPRHPGRGLSHHRLIRGPSFDGLSCLQDAVDLLRPVAAIDRALFGASTGLDPRAHKLNLRLIMYLEYIL